MKLFFGLSFELVPKPKYHQLTILTVFFQSSNNLYDLRVFS